MWGARPAINRSLSAWIFKQLQNERIHDEDDREEDEDDDYFYFDDYNSQEEEYNNSSFEKYPYGNDQEFLREFVYERIRNMSTIHDSYMCERFKDSSPFPSQRLIPYYVGYKSSEINFDEIYLCPKACRPEQHIDWKFC